MTGPADELDPPPLDEFRRAAREWFRSNVARLDDVESEDPHGTASDDSGPEDPDGTAYYGRQRELQRRLFDAGYAGLSWPREYGGRGLSYEYQRAFTEESEPYEMPSIFNVPTFGVLADTLLEFGTEEQKRRHIPQILRGEELWVQFLSEPTGGSDLAGCLMRADRDGDSFVLNGSKVWSSGAHASDYAMCLARTDWDVPKHAGLTMFIVKIHQPGVTVRPIRQVNGSLEFCEEFFDSVAAPASDVIGDVNGGWAVASHLLSVERIATGGGSPYTSGVGLGLESMGIDRSLIELARSLELGDDSQVRQLVAEAHVQQLVQGHLIDWVNEAVLHERLPAAAGAITKLFRAEAGVRRSQLGLEIAASGAAVWPTGRPTPAGAIGFDSLSRQADCLGGGSNEIQRNIISERVLGLPREYAADRGVAFRDVSRGATQKPT